MNKATKLIDSMIQENADDISPLLIQKLGKLRDMMSIKHEGNADDVSVELNEAIHQISDKHNVDMIVISLMIKEGGINAGTSVCLKHSDKMNILSCVMSIPVAMEKLVDELDKSIPGFKMITQLAMMKESMGRDPMSGLGDLLGSLGNKDMKI